MPVRAGFSWSALETAAGWSLVRTKPLPSQPSRVFLRKARLSSDGNCPSDRLSDRSTWAVMMGGPTRSVASPTLKYGTENRAGPLRTVDFARANTLECSYWVMLSWRDGLEARGD